MSLGPRHLVQIDPGSKNLGDIIQKVFKIFDIHFNFTNLEVRNVKP